MKTYYVAALACLLAVSVHAEYEYAKNTNPQVFGRSFEAMHYVERGYEIGRSTLTVSVHCQDSKELAEEAVEDVADQIESLVNNATQKLRLGEANELLGHDFSQKANVYGYSPIAEPNNANEFKCTNGCTGEASERPMRVKNVYAASKAISVWFPNEGRLLNHLSALVTQIEELSDDSVAGVRVKCNSAGGTNFDLAVTKKTEDAAWKEIEAIAKERAREKVRSEFATVQYDNVWKGKEYFLRNQSTALPRLNPVKEGGQWVARFQDTRNYSVYVKQAAAPESQAALLADTRSYKVSAEASASEGLYGIVTISVNQGCLPDQKAAEIAVASVGNPILADLRTLNDGQDSEGNRLRVENASGVQFSPWVAYRTERKPEGTVQHFYNMCTLELKSGPAAPTDKVWQGKMSLTISSPDLDALTELRNRIERDHAREIADPSQVSVSATWQATAKLSVLEQLASQLETSSMAAFLDSKSEFFCEAGSLSFACISSPVTDRGFHEKGMGRSALESMQDAPGAAAYSEGVTSDISAAERGVATFKGKYVVEYTLRKVLIDTNRQRPQPLP